MTWSDPFATVPLATHSLVTYEIVDAGQPWSFDADGEQLRLVTEARRIRLAYLFDSRLEEG